MATVHGLVTVSFEDGLGVPASVAVNFTLNDAATVADAVSGAVALAGFLNDVSDDAILGSTVQIFTGDTAAITSGAETNEGVNISMETSALTRDWAIWVPALKDALIVDDHINIATGAIFNLAAELVTPSGVLFWETPYQNTYTALESAAESFRKLRGLASKKTKSSNPV
jgi:hypothetical protein